MKVGAFKRPASLEAQPETRSPARFDHSPVTFLVLWLLGAIGLGLLALLVQALRLWDPFIH